MHLLLSGRKLIIIATSVLEKYADYYNNFKSTQVDYTTKLRWVLEKPDMWDVVIQDQKFVVPIITFILMQCTDNTYLFKISELAHNGAYMHFFHTFASTEDELTISIGQSVGNAECAMAYARNSKKTECTEENTGSLTKKKVARIDCVRQAIQARQSVAERCITQIINKRKNIQLKKNKFSTRFQKKNYGRKIKKGGEKGGN
jgi:hypothetical protein